MAYENVTPKATTSHAFTRSGTHTNTNYGTGPEVYDDDFGTYYGIYSYSSASGVTTTTIATSEHTWVNAITVPKIKVYVYAAGQAFGNYAQVNNTVYVDLKVSSVWTRVDTATRGGSATSGTLYPTELNDTYTNSGDGWTNVTGIRAYTSGSAFNYEGATTTRGYSYIYEMQCFQFVKKSFSGVI